MKPSDFVCYMQVNNDDFFLSQTVQRMIQEGVSKFFFHVPRRDWGGNEWCNAFVMDMAGFSNDLGRVGIEVQLSIPHVEPANFKSRLDCETYVRQLALKGMRLLHGWHHILVVDGDELWKRGTLAKVIAKVEAGSTCIATKMTSVIGLPGYPVEGGKQDAIIYYGSGREIGECRHPVGDYDLIDGENIFHFTCTRKTKEEIVAKLKGSAHWDDPRYDFWKFIHETLPNIRPGLRDAHTWWQDGSNWPLVREWTEQELEQIPPCYYPYLGTIHT